MTPIINTLGILIGVTSTNFYLYYPGIGGVRIEDTVLVTATGFRILAPCPRHFVIP